MSRPTQCNLALPAVTHHTNSFPFDVLTGADPGFFLGGGALVSCSASTPTNHIVFFFLRNTSCIRKPQVISHQILLHWIIVTPCGISAESAAVRD